MPISKPLLPPVRPSGPSPLITLRNGSLRAKTPFAIQAGRRVRLRLERVALRGGGLLAKEGAAVAMRECVVEACRSSSGGMGVSAQNTGTRVVMAGCQVRSCRRDGVFVFNGAEAALDAVSFSECGEYGIECWGEGSRVRHDRCAFDACSKGDVWRQFGGQAGTGGGVDVLAEEKLAWVAPAGDGGSRAEEGGEGDGRGAGGARGRMQEAPHATGAGVGGGGGGRKKVAVAGASSAPDGGGGADDRAAIVTALGEAEREARAERAKAAELGAKLKALERVMEAREAAYSEAEKSAAEQESLMREVTALRARVAGLEGQVAGYEEAGKGEKGRRGDVGSKGGVASVSSQMSSLTGRVAEIFEERLRERDAEVARLREALRRVAEEGGGAEGAEAKGDATKDVKVGENKRRWEELELEVRKRWHTSAVCPGQ